VTRVVGVGTVKNEADIIEASVRHNLGYLDRIILFDHDSSDATPRILRAMADEGLPISLLSSRTDRREFAFWQGEFTTGLARLAFAQHAADHVVPIDADEFIDVASRKEFALLLDRCPDDVASFEWQTYVPAVDDVPGMHPLDLLRWRVDAGASSLPKIAIPARAATGDWFIARGNHAFCRRKGTRSTIAPAMPIEGLRLAHLPLRSPGQLTAKVLVGWLSRKLAYGASAVSTRNSWHFRALFERIIAGDVITMADVRRYSAAVYAFNQLPSPGDTDNFQVVEHRVANPMPLRYTPRTVVDPARLLAAWASDLVDSLAARGESAP
jgi:glycosyltransferase involved in cell wall biosynthesis